MRFKFLSGVSFFEITLAFRMAFIQVLFAYLSLKLVVESSKNVLISKRAHEQSSEIFFYRKVYTFTRDVRKTHVRHLRVAFAAFPR